MWSLCNTFLRNIGETGFLSDQMVKPQRLEGESRRAVWKRGVNQTRRDHMRKTKYKFGLKKCDNYKLSLHRW